MTAVTFNQTLTRVFFFFSTEPAPGSQERRYAVEGSFQIF